MLYNGKCIVAHEPVKSQSQVVYTSIYKYFTSIIEINYLKKSLIINYNISSSLKVD